MANQFRCLVPFLALVAPACDIGRTAGDLDREQLGDDEIPPGGCDDTVRRLADVPVRAVTGDDEFLYFANAADNVVYRLPKQGGAAVPLGGADPGYRPRELRLDDTHVYWMAFGNEHAVVFRAPKTGGATERVTAYSWGGGMAVQDGWGYFSAFENSGLHRVPLAGGPGETIYDGDDFGFGTELAADASFLYFAGFGSPASFVRMPLAGGDIETLGVVEGNWNILWELELASGFLIGRLTDHSHSPGASGIFCLPQDGGDVLTIVKWESIVGAMDVAEEGLAFAEGAPDGSESRVRVTSLTSGEPQDVVTTPLVSAIHYDDTCIYMGRQNDEPGLYVVADNL